MRTGRALSPVRVCTVRVHSSCCCWALQQRIIIIIISSSSSSSSNSVPLCVQADMTHAYTYAHNKAHLPATAKHKPCQKHIPILACTHTYTHLLWLRQIFVAAHPG